MEGVRKRLSLNLTPSQWVSKSLHLITLFACLGGAFYQVEILVDLFFQYPVTISISAERMENLEFPGITLCTSDGISASVFMDGDPYGPYETRYRERIESLGLPANSTLSLFYQQEILNTLYSDFIMTTDLPDLILKSVNFTNFVLQARCASINTMEEDCIKKLESSFLETFQGRYMCWTMFHESQEDADQDVSDVLMSQVPSPSSMSDLVPAGYRQSAFLLPDSGVSFNALNETIEPREIVRLFVNVSATQSIDLNERAYGILSVHDHDVIRLNKRHSIQIQPGTRYKVYFQEQVTNSLPAPYKSRCYPYVRTNVNKYGIGSQCVHQFFDYPLSRSDCFYGCMAMKSIMDDDCACYPPDIPYLRKGPSCSYGYHSMRKGGNNKNKNDKAESSGDESLNSASNVNEKACHWIRKSMPEAESSMQEIIKTATKEFQQCFGRFEKECMITCPPDCNEVQVVTGVQSFPWPSKKEIALTDDVKEKELLVKYRDNCSLISIRFLSESKIVYTEQPKYSFVEFVSAMGGIVSLWVGFTFVGIFDYIRHSARFLFYVCTGYGKEANDNGATDEVVMNPRLGAKTGKEKISDCIMRKLMIAPPERNKRRAFFQSYGNTWSYDMDGSDMLYDWQPKRGFRKKVAPKFININKKTPFPSHGYPASWYCN